MALRILHVARSVLPEAGSVGICLSGLFSALEQRDIESEVVTADGSGPASQGANVTAVGQDDLLASVSRADLVHLHGWGHGLAQSAARAARTAGKPFIVAPHGTLTPGRYHRTTWKDKLHWLLGEKGLIRQAAALIALNQRESDDLQSRRVHWNVTLLPYGLWFDEYTGDTSAAPTAAAPPDGRYLLMLAPIEPVEGCAVLLKAFAELGRDADGWSVVLAGSDSGPWRKMLEAVVRRKGGNGRVIFTQAPDVATQRVWLARAAAVASPSLHIRPPMSIMQALASGTTAVATNLVAPEGLDENVGVCGPARVELREALRSILRLDDAGREALGDRARSEAVTLFDWSVLADRYAQFYQDMV